MRTKPSSTSTSKFRFKKHDNIGVSDAEEDQNFLHSWKLTGYDRVKTGIARYTNEDGTSFNIPFRFIESSELQAKSVR